MISRTIPFACLIACCGALVNWTAAGLAAADKDKPASEAPRVAVAKCLTASGTILQRDSKTLKWQPVKEGAELFSGDLLVGLPGATMVSKDGAVKLVLQADLEGISPFPTMESAVILHAPDKVDFDYTLDRGRVEVINAKAKGAAQVRLRFHDQKWHLSLDDAGARIAMELYGRWPRGAYFQPKPKKPDPRNVPTAALALVVLKGHLTLKHGSHSHALHAPPGPALFQWDSIAGDESGPRRLPKLPAWAVENESSPLVKKKKAVLEQVRQRIVKNSMEKTLADLLQSDDFAFRRPAVVAMGATDNLTGLVDALGNTKHSDVRDNAILVLRHWIGRCPGQDMKLYKALIEQKKYSSAQAEILLQLLHSFGEAEVGDPETYQTLIAYLGHDKLPIRELAFWHLHRLAPAGKEIPYNAAAPKAARDAGIAKWKKLIPEGKLPPAKAPK